jgi:hypothetical protein
MEREEIATSPSQYGHQLLVIIFTKCHFYTLKSSALSNGEHFS